MIDILQRAAERRRIAVSILAELQLVEQWARFGRPVIVGALAYDLISDPDIDMEIYCPDLRIEHGFDVLRACSENRRVTQALFANHLYGPDKALYWQLRVQGDDGREWKIDMWSAPDDYDLPRSEYFIEPMKAALCEETRRAILELKEIRHTDPALMCISIDLYRAVMQDGVRNAEGLRNWLENHETGQLTDWKPSPR